MPPASHGCHGFSPLQATWPMVQFRQLTTTALDRVSGVVCATRASRGSPGVFLGCGLARTCESVCGWGLGSSGVGFEVGL